MTAISIIIPRHFSARYEIPPRARREPFSLNRSTSIRTRHDIRPTVLPLSFGSLFDARGDGPYVPRWIHNPADAVAPELVRHREQDLRPRQPPRAPPFCPRPLHRRRSP